MLESKEILIRLAFASLFGALIGIERERKHWTAGLRTHMMVCVGSCLIMIVSAYGFKDILHSPDIVLDPSRIAAQVISGIGFIGAGTILLLKKGTIRGLTTASGLWTVAAIGLATGGGLYFAASATTVIALIILWALQPIERTISSKFKYKTLKIVTETNMDHTELLKKILNEHNLKVQTFTLDKSDEDYIFLLEFENGDRQDLNDILNDLGKNPSIKEISWS